MDLDKFTALAAWSLAVTDGDERDLIEELAKSIIFTYATSIAGDWRFSPAIMKAGTALGWTYEQVREWAYSDEARDWAYNRT